jgi:hemin uptake protein HemP
MSKESSPRQDHKNGDEDRVVRTSELFHGEREICIEHDGIRYRLRITRRNKLILQK